MKCKLSNEEMAINNGQLSMISVRGEDVFNNGINQ